MYSLLSKLLRNITQRHVKEAGEEDTSTLGPLEQCALHYCLASWARHNVGYVNVTIECGRGDMVEDYIEDIDAERLRGFDDGLHELCDGWGTSLFG